MTSHQHDLWQAADGSLVPFPLREIRQPGTLLTSHSSRPGGTVNVTTTAEIELAEITIPPGKANRVLLVLARAMFTKDAGITTRAMRLRLRRGIDNTGTLLVSAACASCDVASSPFGTGVLVYADAPGAEEVNYRLSALNFVSATIVANDRDIEVLEIG